jgi:hypothetical protein
VAAAVPGDPGWVAADDWGVVVEQAASSPAASRGTAISRSGR